MLPLLLVGDFVEIITDLSAETFLLAFRRFASRRSLPSCSLTMLQLTSPPRGGIKSIVQV